MDKGHLPGIKFVPFLVWVLLTGMGQPLHAQHYQAVHGSPYSGSLGVYNNPSSIVNTPYKWDLTLLGGEFQTISNTVRGPNFPFYLAPDRRFSAAAGNYPRKADLNYNVRLLNARFSLNRQHAFAFGMNVRGYVQAASGQLNYNDSVVGPRSFLLLNEQNRVISADMTGSLWMEWYGSYARTVFDRASEKLNVGVSLKLLRSMSGAFLRLRDVGVERVVNDNMINYQIVNGSARYGFSANHGDGSSFEAADLLSGGKTGLAFDLGAEYLVKSQAVTSVFDEETPIDYEWKIGVSLLDIGWNRYDFSEESRQVASLQDGVTNLVLQDKFSSVRGIRSFNDSLATITNTSDQLTGQFRIWNPARLVINADRYISGNFFVNGELTLHLPAGGGDKLAVRESGLLTLTPRWETKRWGAYLPLQYTRHGNFWIGAGIKAGPLLMGTHNLLNLFSRNNYLGGGAYIALIIRPSEMMKDSRNRQYDCPTY